jgi:hypothetical protein
VKNLPTYLFAVTSVINLMLIYFTVPIWMHENVFIFVNEWIGNSVLFNIYMAAQLRKVDPVNRVAILGLLMFNAINILFMSVESMDYDFVKGLVVQAIVLTVGGYILIQPLIKNYGR